MAGAFRIFAKLGFADGGSGHISLRDPVQPDTFWINPYALHFSRIKVSDLVHVDEEGRRIGGADKPVNTAGFIIHSAIHKARPDINAACHCHSPYGRAWSTFGKPIDMLNQGMSQVSAPFKRWSSNTRLWKESSTMLLSLITHTDSCMFYNDLSVYKSFGGVVFAKEEGGRIVDSLGTTNKNVILKNHGLLTAGSTVAEAAAFFIALERACQTQLLVESAIGGGQLEKEFVGEEEAEYTKKGTGSPEVMYMQFVPEYQAILEETKGDFLR